MATTSMIAVNRFGYGAKPNELILVAQSPKEWLIKQLSQSPPVAFNYSLPSSSDIFIQLHAYRKNKKVAKKIAQELAGKDFDKQMSMEGVVTKKARNPAHKLLNQLSSDAIDQAIRSDHSLNWRLLDFFSNHFSVSASGPVMTAIAPTLEREAIAPNLLGNFEDLLLSVCQHPAMLIYLNNERSFGTNSQINKNGRGKKKVGLNENLAREILELHTLGVNGGYQQQDVTALAKGITGWSVARIGRDEGSGFLYRANGHEPGSLTLLGKSYKKSRKNAKQGEMMLRDLANHPATARHISFKLAYHFISEQPPESLINKMVKRWLATKGNIREVMITLINAEESWHADSQKFKTPREFVISSLRSIGDNKKLNLRQLMKSLSALGQKPFSAGSPAGFSDSGNDWNGGSAIMARINWSAALSSKLSFKHTVNVETIMSNSFGKNISELSYNTILRAESKEQAMTLLLMSPEFQRR
ncbi:DUF1800 domain-containing protein [Colwellia sp. 75C3]|uniref:DUF1800 domain-containing protein n=1 Tax=Colwellia sp. 75C3 TaxID=888425 RepID=UPI000C334A9A|nr:DUF1800 domain-containing protein [Colwellia sp. 75C3]PKG81875.1 DUF1800 domain-containing protein [Colwellia sp. 75C3]